MMSFAFGAVYVSLSIVAHYFFRSNAFDLGIFNQAMYLYAHGEVGPNTVRGVTTLLQDHAEILLPLLSPLTYS
jgi:uncharacterized membrane protein